MGSQQPCTLELPFPRLFKRKCLTPSGRLLLAPTQEKPLDHPALRSGVFLAGPLQPEKKGLIQEGNPAWEMTPSKLSLALSLASLNFYCLQPCDSGLPDLAPCQPCTAAGTSSDLSACNGTASPADTGPGFCFHTLGCPVAVTARALLARLWTIPGPSLQPPVMGLPWPWALQCPLSSSVLLSRVYSLSVIESFTPQMPTVMSTPQQALL